MWQTVNHIYIDLPLGVLFPSTDLCRKVSVEQAHDYRAQIEGEGQSGEHRGHRQEHGPHTRGDKGRVGRARVLLRHFMRLKLEDQNH